MLLGTGEKMDRNLFPLRKSQSRSSPKGQSPVAGEKDTEGGNDNRKGLTLQRGLP